MTPAQDPKTDRNPHVACWPTSVFGSPRFSYPLFFSLYFTPSSFNSFFFRLSTLIYMTLDGLGNPGVSSWMEDGILFSRPILDPLFELFLEHFGNPFGVHFRSKTVSGRHFFHSIFETIFDFVLDHLLLSFWMPFGFFWGVVFHHFCEGPETLKIDDSSIY